MRRSALYILLSFLLFLGACSEHGNKDVNNLRIDSLCTELSGMRYSDKDSFDFSNLSEEMILAGILTILAYDKKNPNIQYYRSIITKAKPNIKKELSEAAILKARNEDFDIAEEIFDALRGLDPEDIAIVLNTALFFDQRADSYRGFRP